MDLHKMRTTALQQAAQTTQQYKYTSQCKDTANTRVNKEEDTYSSV